MLLSPTRRWRRRGQRCQEQGGPQQQEGRAQGCRGRWQRRWRREAAKGAYAWCTSQQDAIQLAGCQGQGAPARGRSRARGCDSWRICGCLWQVSLVAVGLVLILLTPPAGQRQKATAQHRCDPALHVAAAPVGMRRARRVRRQLPGARKPAGPAQLAQRGGARHVPHLTGPPHGCVLRASRHWPGLPQG